MRTKNNMTYEETKALLKELEILQTQDKAWKLYFSKFKRNDMVLHYTREINKRKDLINIVLSAIHAHKQARHYFGKLKDLEKGKTNV